MVAICAGLMFVMVGLAIILDYGMAGGAGADGDLPQGTPMNIRIGNLLLGGTIRVIFGFVAALMALMFLTCTIVGVERLWRARKQ